MWHLIVGLTTIVFGTLVVMWFGIRWLNRPAQDDPVEHFTRREP